MPHPAEAFGGSARRLVLASDPARVAKRIHPAEQKGKIDFTGAGLMPCRRVGNLHVGDERPVTLEGRRQIAFHYLHVVHVVLDEQIIRRDRFYNLHGLLGAAQKRSRDVARVLIGSISGLMRADSRRRAASRRITTRGRAPSGGINAGRHDPARQFTCVHPSAVACSIA